MLTAFVFHRVVTQRKEHWTDVSLDVLKHFMQTMHQQELCSTDPANFQKKGVILSFDDGNASDYEVVFPALLELGMQGIFFIITDRVGTQGYLDWHQIQEMDEHGMVIGSHTHTHKDLILTPKKNVVSELEISKKIIEDYLQHNIDSMSYPFGRRSKTVDNIAKGVGYRYAYTSEPGIVGSDDFLVPRMSVHCGHSHADIEGLVRLTEMQVSKMKFNYQVRSSIKKVIGNSAYKLIRSMYQKAQ